MELLSYLAILSLAILGLPLFVAMSLFGLCAYLFADAPGATMAVEIYRMASTPTLLAIPLFTLAGHVMAESKSPQRLLRLAQVCLGGIPGGLAITALVVCAFFTAFTGASGVSIIALGGLLYPILRKQNYPEDFSLGLITSSGSLGLLFPPSLPIILYGLVAKVDIEQLFIAGIVPGILLIAILGAWSVKNAPAPTTRWAFERREFLSALRDVVSNCCCQWECWGAFMGGWPPPAKRRR